MKWSTVYMLIRTISIFFDVISYSTEEKPLVVISCMYNNEHWVEKNLSMIFAQKYNNFRLIIVDDSSTDKTNEMIQSFIKKNKLSNKITLIKNKNRKRKLANLYTVLHTVDDEDIVIIIDGDDWLAHPYVFSYINNVYDQDIFFTYGQYQNIPASESIAWGFNPMGYARPIPEIIVNNHSYRKGPFYYMHLRTFKGWIFKLIKLEDLLSETVEGFIGDFFPASNDLAMYYPIVEMAHTKVHFVPDILYMRNVYSNLVGFKIDRKIQIDSGREIKRKKPYNIVKEPIYRNLDYLKEKTVDVVVCTEQIKKYTYYKKQFKNSAFIQLKSIVNYIDTLTHDYVLLSFDQNYFPSAEQAKMMIYELEKTFAQALFCFERKECENITQGLSIACLEEQKLYASKHTYFLSSTKNIDKVKSILLRTIDFKRIVKKAIPIQQAVCNYFNKNQSNISLLCFDCKNFIFSYCKGNALHQGL